MTNQNKRVGNSFEADLCEYLACLGFWAHNMVQGHAGQPADILAVRNGTAFLIDAKVCKGDMFSLSRIEENQRFAMQLWTECGNGQGWFCIRFPSDIWMVPMSRFLACRQKSVGISWMKKHAIRLDEWVKEDIWTS